MKRFFKNLNTVVILTLIIILSAISGISAEAISTPGVTAAGTNGELETELAQALATTKLDYAAHVQNIGWQQEVQDGELAGTTGAGLSIEALKINLENALNLDTGSIEYSLHCQNVGWTPVVRDGEVGGTTGEGLNAQAIRINLVGRVAESYDIFYRVHSANYGWLDWTSNGNIAGTTGIDTRAEAIEIKLVRKGTPIPGPTDRPYISDELLAQEGVISYYTLNNDYWQEPVFNGDVSGTTGIGAPVRGIAIDKANLSADSCIEYQGYFSNVGWYDPIFRNGEGLYCGGEQLESIAIALKGLDDYSYDLYYQVHVSNIGWLGWAREGEVAGTQGGGLAIEAIRIMMLPRNAQGPECGNAFQQIIPPDNSWRWPLDGYGFEAISSGFGYRDGGMHDGCDIIAPAGTPIHACKSGTVVVAGWYYGYGQCVVVVNDSGEQVYYAHMSAIGTNVGAHVEKGQVIGFVGCTGQATCNHLHLGLIVGGNWADPCCVF